jgi:hypothetical protein
VHRKAVGFKPWSKRAGWMGGGWVVAGENQNSRVRYEVPYEVLAWVAKGLLTIFHGFHDALRSSPGSRRLVGHFGPEF